MGLIHLKNVLDSEDFELISIVTKVSNAASFGVPAFDSLQAALLFKRPDCVIISSQSAKHAEMVKVAASAGLFVLCEKPIGFDHDQLVLLGTLSEIERSRVAVGYNRRFDSDRVRVRTELQGGRIGTPELLLITSRDPFMERTGYSAQAAFLDTLSHDLDMAEWILSDRITTIHSSPIVAEAFSAADGSLPAIMLQVTTTRGTLCNINVSFNSRYGYDQRIEVAGEHGMICVGNPMDRTSVVYDASGAHLGRLHSYYGDRYVDTYTAELKAFGRFVAGESSELATFEEGRRAAGNALLALQAGQTGATVVVHSSQA